MSGGGFSRRAALVRLAGGALAASGGLACADAPLRAPEPRPRLGASRRFPEPAELVAEAGIDGRTSWHLLDLATGQTLGGGAPEEAHPPASVAKAPTALYALDALGLEARLPTRLLATGGISGGALEGDLALQGGGDPELDSVGLRDLARALAARGVRRISGAFLADPGPFGEVPLIDPGQADVAAYNPGVGGLNLNFNRVFFEWRGSAGGLRTTVEARADGLSPRTAAVAADLGGPAASGPAFRHLGGAAPERWSVNRAALRRPGARWLPVRAPALYAAQVFRDLAAAEGIALPAPRAGAAAPLARTLAERHSRPLREIVRAMLRHSTNLTAETLGLAASHARGRDTGSLGASAAAMSLWAGEYADGARFDLRNHSGLSGESRARARAVTTLMAEAERRRSALAGPDFAALLPERAYLDDDQPAPAAPASVRAKSGTINFARGLGGYLDLEDGRRLAFAIFTSNPARRSAAARSDNPRGAAGWMNRARRLERAILRSWIAEESARR